MTSQPVYSAFALSLVPESDAMLFFLFLSKPAGKKTVTADHKTLAQILVRGQTSQNSRHMMRVTETRDECSWLNESESFNSRSPLPTRALVIIAR